MDMKKFFPSAQKSIGLIALTVIGTLTAIAVNRYFGIEQKVPRSDMSRVG
jgi:hypothetical protein